MIGGVNLSGQQFHRAVSDDDIGNTIRRRTPSGMPAFDLDPAQIGALVAYVRSGFAAFDAGSGGLLCKANLGGPIVMAPITYQIDGQKVLAVITGNVLAAFALADCTKGKSCS
jgi:hypothetical protein